MTAGPANDLILIRFREAVERHYGSRIVRIVLFGSRARGDACVDSDYDIGVFLTDFQSFDREARALAEIETNLLFETGAVVNALPLPSKSYTEHMACMREMQRDGREL